MSFVIEKTSSQKNKQKECPNLKKIRGKLSFIDKMKIDERNEVKILKKIFKDIQKEKLKKLETYFEGYIEPSVDYHFENYSLSDINFEKKVKDKRGSENDAVRKAILINTKNFIMKELGLKKLKKKERKLETCQEDIDNGKSCLKKKRKNPDIDENYDNKASNSIFNWNNDFTVVGKKNETALMSMEIKDFFEKYYNLSEEGMKKNFVQQLKNINSDKNIINEKISTKTKLDTQYKSNILELNEKEKILELEEKAKKKFSDYFELYRKDENLVYNDAVKIGDKNVIKGRKYIEFVYGYLTYLDFKKVTEIKIDKGFTSLKDSLVEKYLKEKQHEANKNLKSEKIMKITQRILKKKQKKDPSFDIDTFLQNHLDLRFKNRTPVDEI